MKTISERAKQIRVMDKCDVFVAGGGIAGVSAAIAAARNGSKVILCEKQCILGGLATAGLVTIYLPLCDGLGKQVSFGIAEELLKLSVCHHIEAKYPKPWFENGTDEEKAKTRYEVRFNPHMFALEMEKLLKDLGVKILYDTMICDVNVEDEKINAVIVENKSGRMAYETVSVVDASGDADLCKFSGAKTEVYKKQNLLAAWSYFFKQGRIDLNMLGYAEVSDEDKTGDEPEPLTKRRFTGLDGEEISEMLCLAHEQMRNKILAERKTDDTYVPSTIPTMPQLRMTRKIVGKYILDDKEMHKRFDDSIGMISDWRKRGPVYEVPFSALYGGDIKNLICAGRCISVTDAMWDISRVIPPCAVTGQAAGTAAAMCDDFSMLDIKKLQNKLVGDGVILHEDEL